MLPAAALPLQRLYAHERERATQPYLIQPLADGRVLTLSWGETMRQVRHVAGWLRAQDWPHGSKIAVLAKNSAWWFIADFAIWMAGHVSVPLFHTLQAASILPLIEHAGCRACFVGRLDDPGVVDALPAGLPRLHLPDTASTHGDGVDWPTLLEAAPIEGEPLRDADEIATIVYTSGTTGTPKGVMHRFATLGLVSSLAVRMFGASEHDRLISYLPLAHIADRGFAELASIQLGCRVYFAWSVDSFVDDLRRARPTMLLSVPRLWAKFQQGITAQLPQAKLARLLKLPLVGRHVRRKILRALGLDALRVAFSGAAPTPPELFGFWRALGVELLEVYGMSENFGIAHVGRIGEFRPGYIGRPWDGVDARIDAQTGELQMRSPGVMAGYYQAPALTAEAFSADGYLRTGDCGELSADGLLKITGRIKEQFKTAKGKFVVPSPIENHLCADGLLEACCVTGGDALPAPLALAMLGAERQARCRDDADYRAQTQTQLEALLAGVNARLDRHERLACLVVTDEAWTVETGLVTPTMKVKRNALEHRYRPRMAAWCAQQRPVIWADPPD
ncbi:AMP-binding protein [Solimonas sp. C16B3]|uniref:AMP-binding protein n=2 Tax=Solimonas marina TaxID=2714601 RepID=A0A970B760_9GAMM|nr:AMP-binding protein [Solimonas marina]